MPLDRFKAVSQEFKAILVLLHDQTERAMRFADNQWIEKVVVGDIFEAQGKTVGDQVWELTAGWRESENAIIGVASKAGGAREKGQ